MADTAIARVTLGHDVDQRQVIGPNYSYGVVALADILAHALVIDGRGKGRLTVLVTNATDQTVTATVYGSQTEDGDPADLTVLEIGGTGGSTFEITTGISNYECYNDPFPWYIVRIKAAVKPDGENVTVYTNLQSA